MVNVLGTPTVFLTAADLYWHNSIVCYGQRNGFEIPLERAESERRLRQLVGMRVDQWLTVIRLPGLIEHGLIGVGGQNDLGQGGPLTSQSDSFPSCVCLKKYVKTSFAFWGPQLYQIFESKTKYQKQISLM